MVVDVRPRHITFDVLERNVPQAGIMGKERAILSALAALPGVCLTDKSYIHSNGILGLICADVEEPEAVLDRVSNMTREIQEKVSRRAIVFPTGFELKQGMIQDTNTPFLKHELEERGYYVTVGAVSYTHLSALDGREGYLYEYSGLRFDPFGSDWYKTLGNRYDVCTPGFAIKQYPSCSSTHRAVDAFVDLAQVHHFQPEDIASIRVELSAAALRAVSYTHLMQQSEFSDYFSGQNCRCRGNFTRHHTY